MSITKYETLVFDCDGVVLNSNKVKTEAFYKAALPYGETAAQQLVDYHVARGGISRYKKFEWFVQNAVSGRQGPDLESLLEAYATEVRTGLLNCTIVEGLAELREKTANANWLIVSGGDQAELRAVFKQRGLDTLFGGGIFGSPDSKDTILARELKKGTIKTPALFLGDSKYDYEASQTAKLDFVFLSYWTEVSDWQSFCDEYRIDTVSRLTELLGQ